MVPVELRLSNFLSYGTDAPPLDFEQFHVACLSGRNGQGKSALLDAMTWALWGQARKSAGGHKPDDELLRMGTRDMSVSFVFDIQGERFRVARSYRRSASGKTSTPGLELQVLDREQQDFRPLTAASLRETQQRIDELVGLDYDTFVNSSFLLQGRSDEFTKKRPQERKQILAAILDLGRFDRLADMARERASAAAERVALGERDAERLSAIVAEAPALAEQEREARTAAEAAAKALAEARTAEQRARETLAAGDALAAERDDIRGRQRSAEQRRGEDEADAKRLREQIGRDEALIARSAEIRAAARRHAELGDEVRAWVERAELVQGIDAQVAQLRAERKERVHTIEKRVASLDADRRAAQAALNEARGVAAERADVSRKLAAARVASERAEAMKQQLADYEARVSARDAARNALQEARAAHAAHLAALRQAAREAHEALRDRTALEAEVARQLKRVDEEHALAEALETVREQGEAAGETLQQHEALLAALVAERDDRAAQRRALAESRLESCPTCGTELTPEHREEVARDIDERLAQLEARIAKGEATVAAVRTRREALRSEFAEKRKAREALRDAAARHAEARERLEADARQRTEATKKQEALARAEQGHDAGPRGASLEAALGKAEAAVVEAAFDREAYERVREQAAQRQRWEERMRAIEVATARADELAAQIERLERQAGELRASLDDGAALAETTRRIDALVKQRSDVGYDAQRRAQAQQAHDALAEAPAQLNALLDAQEKIEERRERLSRIEKRLAEAASEMQAWRTRLEEIEVALKDRDQVAERARAAADEVARAEKAMGAAQRRVGEIGERLQRVAAARSERDAIQERIAEARTEQATYRQLRQAFGKHGIPSLIIEETLPELEARANDLLDQLSDGRMRVRLETLRDKKTGGTKETLDIVITDEGGAPRAYETYSGGEAFRVNFALRIALSQLLAERSGVQIRTLVIDEGFGTQDAQGVQNMIEAIQAIQGDFDKILVITHLDALKEAFPVRIEVQKDPVTGSTFEVMGV